MNASVKIHPTTVVGIQNPPDIEQLSTTLNAQTYPTQQLLISTSNALTPTVMAVTPATPVTVTETTFNRAEDSSGGKTRNNSGPPPEKVSKSSNGLCNNFCYYILNIWFWVHLYIIYIYFFRAIPWRRNIITPSRISCNDFYKHASYPLIERNDKPFCYVSLDKNPCKNPSNKPKFELCEQIGARSCLPKELSLMFFGDTEEGDGKKPGEEDLDNAKFVNNAEFKCPGARGAGGAGNDNTILRNTSRRYLGEECIPCNVDQFFNGMEIVCDKQIIWTRSRQKKCLDIEDSSNVGIGNTMCCADGWGASLEEPDPLFREDVERQKMKYNEDRWEGKGDYSYGYEDSVGELLWPILFMFTFFIYISLNSGIKKSSLLRFYYKNAIRCDKNEFNIIAQKFCSGNIQLETKCQMHSLTIIHRRKRGSRVRKKLEWEGVQKRELHEAVDASNINLQLNGTIGVCCVDFVIRYNCIDLETETVLNNLTKAMIEDNSSRGTNLTAFNEISMVDPSLTAYNTRDASANGPVPTNMYQCQLLTDLENGGRHYIYVFGKESLSAFVSYCSYFGLGVINKIYYDYFVHHYKVVIHKNIRLH